MTEKFSFHYVYLSFGIFAAVTTLHMTVYAHLKHYLESAYVYVGNALRGMLCRKKSVVLICRTKPVTIMTGLAPLA
ncbi:hypothetical protein [Acinetobacter larvae]|uniref:hypothetical protein n=1 Tax=Acinetobacter larvae TaxID=1789224 RepID=UPI0012FD5769|nr:hypothetical protein [Acinetobacter larvae]